MVKDGIMSQILNALVDRYNAQISEAKAVLEIYLNKSVGIGEHPEIVQAIEMEVAKMAEAQDKLDTVNQLLNEKEFIQD